MNQLGPTRPDRNASIQVFNLWYQNLGSISLLVWKLYAFRQSRNFGNFQKFFLHNFRQKWKFWILIASPERSSPDLRICQIKKIVLIKINFLVKNLKNIVVYFDILPKFSDFGNSDNWIGKIASISIRLQPVFIYKKKFEVNKKTDFLWWKNLELR